MVRWDTRTRQSLEAFESASVGTQQWIARSPVSNKMKGQDQHLGMSSEFRMCAMACVYLHLHTSTHKSNTHTIFKKNTHIMKLSSRRPSRTITINPVVFFSTAIPPRAILRGWSWVGVIPFGHFIGGMWVCIGVSVAQKLCLFLASLSLRWSLACWVLQAPLPFPAGYVGVRAVVFHSPLP